MTRRLLLSYLTVTVLVLIILEVPLAVFYAQRERERTASGLEHDASVIATLYEDALEGDQPLDSRPADEYSTRTGARVVVVDRDGISRVDTAQDADRDFSTRPEIELALQGIGASGTRSSETLGTDLVYVAVPVASGGTIHGALRVTLDTSDVTDRIHRFWLGLAGVAIVVLIAVGLIGWGIARSVTSPIRRLNAAASRFAAGVLTTADEPSTGPPEVRALADTMTMMARRLDELLRTQRRFVADASHQLRTPLTALRLRLENLQTEVPTDSSAALEAAIDETARLATLVTNLLQLARADEHRTVTVVDLAGLTDDRIDTWTAAAEASEVRLVAETADHPAMVEAVPGSVEQILDNLLDNAVNASPRGGTITVTVTPTPGKYVLSVVDEGPGLSDDQKSNAMRRFWRGTTATPGTGLGLAIVDALASACGATVHLGDAAGRGLAVTVTFAAAHDDNSTRVT